MASPRRKRIVSATASLDPGRNFVGGPAGDLSNVGLIIPTDPTTSQYRRFLVRLAALQIESRVRAHITSIRQLLTIAAKLPILQEERLLNRRMMVGGGEPAPDPCEFAPAILLEREVRTPHWSFPDGNVVWFLREMPIRSADREPPAVYRNGWDRDPYGLDSAILYLNPAPGAYVPPANGVPPGDPIGMYGTIRSIEFPWRTHTSNQNALELEVDGPCIIAMYASIWQTDPATRPVPALGPGLEQFTTESGIEEEDLFWISNPCSRYHRIGAELTVELEELPSLPCADTGAACRQPQPGDDSVLPCLKDEDQS